MCGIRHLLFDHSFLMFMQIVASQIAKHYGKYFSPNKLVQHIRKSIYFCLFCMCNDFINRYGKLTKYVAVFIQLLLCFILFLFLRGNFVYNDIF